MNPAPGLIGKGVEQGHGKALEVAHVSGDDGQFVHERGGRDHGVLIDRVRLSVPQFRPQPEGRGIHGQDVVGLGELIGPPFY